MIPKRYIDEITNILVGYAGKIDALANTKQRLVINLEDEIEEMKGKYTDSYIKEYRQNYKFPDYRPQMNAERNASRDLVSYYLETIEKQLDSYFMAPVRTDFANKINSIKITGLKLSDREFEMLAKSAKSYMEMRLLNQLAETRTKAETKITIDPETREPKRETGETAAPYMYLKVPDLDKCYEAFNNFKRGANYLLDSYSGANAELAEFLENGVSKLISASANSYFRNKSAEAFAQVMSEQGEILAKTGIKTTLTDRDKKVIDALINEPFPKLYQDKVKARVKTISEGMPEIGNLLRLDDRYKGYLEEA